MFSNIEGKVFANHVRWCDQNKTNGDKGGKSISDALQRREIVEKGERFNFTVLCVKCKKSFLVYERSKLHPERSVYYCSRSCAYSRVQSELTRQKIRNTLRKNPETYTKECEFCNSTFSTPRKHQKYCSRVCGSKNRFRGDKRLIGNTWENVHRTTVKRADRSLQDTLKRDSVQVKLGAPSIWLRDNYKQNEVRAVFYDRKTNKIVGTAY